MAPEDPPASVKSPLATAFVALLATGGLALVDLVTDFRGGSPPVHLALEGVAALLGVVGVFGSGRYLLRLRAETSRARAEADDLAVRLEATERDAARWRSETRALLDGLGAAIDAQFGRWGLSPAEREVALLLLKGLSHKEIASVRAVSEATARQQAGAVYKKAGVAGRNDLAAFFLEDLLASRPASP